ncbi:hypothetical protein JOF41_001755 [Saccharothrix coeruleofusca]|uniref:PucR family transcriptional regulator n=1 Tax=Saccharothrix coeruleofusca TaxID=33919 RepID=UPI001AE2AC54|nr:helix-turn-helix domain-containing protein [Saccharothrix coeruleofusca]MBP2335577.1 hypothetical protein [Saccharothrix coeruleofusca]
MEGLLLRLSALDADAEAAVRVIACFDALVEGRASLPALVRCAAGLAECPAGLVLPGVEPIRMREDGSELSAPAPAMEFGAVESGAVDLDGSGRVWLERPGPARPLDDLVLERFAMAARLLADRPRRDTSPHLADPGLVELVLAERAAAEDRTRALRLLGFDTAGPVRVIAVSAPAGQAGAAVVRLFSRGRAGGRLRAAAIGEVQAVLLQPRPGGPDEVARLRAALGEHDPRDVGVRIGVGSPVDGLDARSSWTQARTALRFAVAGAAERAVVDHGSLGSLALLADLPVERLRADPDVAALDRLAATPFGAQAIAALEALCRNGSLRRAAAVLHLHHSSVAARLEHVEDALGLSLDEPDGRFRARLALTARGLARSAAVTPRGRA